MIASSVPWPVAIGLAAVLALIAFVWGESRRSTYTDGQHARLVGQIASLRTVVRVHYNATGHAMPDLWDGGPEPQPGRWDNAIRWIKARFRGPAEVEALPTVEPVWKGPATVTSPKAAPKDPGPDTTEVPAQPPTVPMAAAIDDDWEARQEALHEEWLAEIRGETEKEKA